MRESKYKKALAYYGVDRLEMVVSLGVDPRRIEDLGKGPSFRRYTLSMVTPGSGTRSPVVHASIQAATAFWGDTDADAQLREAARHFSTTLPTTETAIILGGLTYAWNQFDDRSYENDLILYHATGSGSLVQSLVGDFQTLLPEGMATIFVHETAYDPFSAKSYALEPSRSLSFSAWHHTLATGSFGERARTSYFADPKVLPRKTEVPEHGPIRGTVEPQRSVRSSL